MWLWGRVFTAVAFIATYLYIIYCTKKVREAIKLWRKMDTAPENRELKYLRNTFYAYLIGITWFKLWKRRNIFIIITHAGILFYGVHELYKIRKDTYDTYDKGDKDPFWFRYYDDVVVGYLTVAQAILSIHLIMVRYGRTPEEMAVRSGLHNFMGTLVFLGLIHSYVGVTHEFPIHSVKKGFGRNGNGKKTYEIVMWTFITTFPVFFLVLNPYFEWRRLYFLVYYDYIQRKRDNEKKLRRGRRTNVRKPVRGTPTRRR